MTLGLTALELARIQFAFTVSFHIIFPAISIGLASFLAVLEWRWLRTNNPIYQDLFKYWVKIFAVAFGMGVVSGVVMSYQFGTNWSEFSRFAGGVTGPLLTYEVLSALEAGFLGIMLFGWGRVGKSPLLCHPYGCNWHLYFNVLDFVFKQLDANSSRIHN